MTDNTRRADGVICVCPSCKRPTFFDLQENKQLPGILVVGNIGGLPINIQSLWMEIGSCMSQGAYTSAVLSGRKMLMHIAVERGATTDMKFIEYVDYLVDNHYAPPNSKDWIDRVRLQGNEATHDIVIKTVHDTREIVTFLEMLLRFIYEFPAMAKVAP